VKGSAKKDGQKQKWEEGLYQSQGVCLKDMEGKFQDPVSDIGRKGKA